MGVGVKKTSGIPVPGTRKGKNFLSQKNFWSKFFFVSFYLNIAEK